MENNETPQKEQPQFTIKKPHNKKARPLIVDQLIEQARGRVIAADLEISFLTSLKESVGDVEKYKDYMEDIEKQKIIYEFFLKRLNFFKELRDKMKMRDIEKIKEEAEKEPEQIKVKLSE